MCRTYLTCFLRTGFSCALCLAVAASSSPGARAQGAAGSAAPAPAPGGANGSYGSPADSFADQPGYAARPTDTFAGPPGPDGAPPDSSGGKYYAYWPPGARHYVLVPRGSYPAPPYSSDGSPTYPSPYGPMFPQSGTGYAPPGLTLPLVLVTAISSRSSKDGDPVEASVARNVPLQGCGYVPAGSILSGRVTQTKRAGFMEKGGGLGVTFGELKLPDGRSFPVSGHLLGGLGAVGDGAIPYTDTHGSIGWMNRMENMGVTPTLSQVVAGVGTIPFNYPLGANYLTAFSSPSNFLGLVNLAGGLLRKGHDVIVPSGANFQFQLDTALTIPVQNAGPRTASGYQGN